MTQRLIEAVGSAPRLRALTALKRTQGLCVDDLAARLGMSYNGTKDICLELHRRGLLDVRREPSSQGRPRLLYRLTDRARDLFPTASNAATLELLEAARQLYGHHAPEKLLILLFQRHGERLAEKIHGATLAERAESLARLREAEGCMAELERGPGGALAIVEHHSPILDLLRAHPIVARLEAAMFERLLGVPVAREEQHAGGLYCGTFRLALASPPPRDGVKKG